jgi:hypothetical protein
MKNKVTTTNYNSTVTDSNDSEDNEILDKDSKRMIIRIINEFKETQIPE